MSKTPQQVLDATESAELYFPLEYAYTLLIICISLCYSLLSPIVLPCALLYMILKCLVNRILMYFVFGKKLNPQKEKIDYTSIFSESWLIVKIMLWNLMIFVLYHVIYFGLKISVDLIFISHFVLELILLIGLIGLYVLLFFFKNWILTKFLRIKHEILDPTDPRIITFKPDLKFTYYDENVEKEQEENLLKNEQELKEGEKPEVEEIKKEEEEEFIVGSPEISERTNLMQVKVDHEVSEKEKTMINEEMENSTKE
jgi:glucan phosphoethanolaminetransferase (alkaline phosphatase superfamily)